MNALKKTFSQADKLLSGGKSSAYGSNMTFVHGQLIVDVIGARDLPDLEGFLSKMIDKKDVSDPFVDVKLGKVRLAKTSIIDNNLNPTWNESYRLEVCHFANELTFEIRDKDHAYSELIGYVEIPTADLMTGQIIDRAFDIKKRSNSSKTRGTLHVKVEFRPKHTMMKTYEVDCYFPMKTGCHVTLYQDAHCLPNHLSSIPFGSMERPDGQIHQPRSCWSDEYHTLLEAKEIICITGWAVWDKLKLFRGQDCTIDRRTLGQILVDKANQGVKVYVMVWSEKTSGDIIGEKGVMGTHDMETYNAFKNTKVNCALAPRELDDIKELTDALQNQFSSGAYTHHQKSIICDAEASIPGSPGRRLVAFVGGLDLTGGRYDTPDHELFKTLLVEHGNDDDMGNDFRNSNAKFLSPTQGPREPWHDIHSKVEGQIAYDVFLNFKERWEKQGTSYGNLIPIEHTSVDVNAPLAIDPQKAWNVQFFRSITSDSAVFDPSLMSHMNSKKGRQVDSSIAQAYIQLIRHAEHFIYIENQYFLGSAYCWNHNDDVNCNHTIPAEITQHIIEKINANQRFTAYVMIPMFPEGDPASAPIQEILYWQFKTIEMMYKRIGEAISQCGSQSHPTDWLLFLCPGKREAPGEHLERLEPVDELTGDPSAKRFRDKLRFPIYVHSKMMIVDDAYILVGSANINQRSMAGTRDTEMAVGCWQPAFPDQNPYGDVHIFRKSLWMEHFHVDDPVFRHPGSQECLDKVKEMAKYNWDQYSDDKRDGITTPGQVLCYPLDIRPDGKIGDLGGMTTFPDFGPNAKIKGTISTFIPQKVTT